MEYVEGWAFTCGGNPVPGWHGGEQNLVVLAPPANSRLVDAQPVAGRWVQPGDTKAVAITEGILRSSPT